MRCFPIALALLACSSTPSEPTGLLDSAADTRTLDMVLVASGSFTIGCTPAQEEFCDDEEKPTRDITLSRAFWMTEHEVTQRDFIQLMSENPSENGDCLNCPVEQVSWDDAARFANALSQLEGLPTCYACREGGCEPEEAWLDCRGYRLPTEAEWEYAARCGTDTIYAGGDDAFTLAWTRRNSLDSTQPVGELTPNACGLYDLSGNVWEWVHDYFGSYANLSATDPTGPEDTSARVVRGGAWNLEPSYARVSNRRDVLEESENNIGFRLVQSDIR